MTNEQIIQYIKENYPTQSDVYFWSTFILPDGTFVLPENDDEDYVDDIYEHANIIGGVADNCFDGYWYDAELWLELNCVKGNANYPYLHFPNNPTNKLYWAAEDYMDQLNRPNNCGFDIRHAYDEEDVFNMKTPIYVSLYGKGGKAYDLGIYKPNEIIDRIKKAKVSGVLEEKLNSGIKESTRDSRVRDKDGSLILCSLLPHESLDNSEYGIYFKRGKDYYLNITNPLFTDATDDIVTYLRKMGYEKELDRFKLMKLVKWDYQLNEVEFVKYLGFDGIITYDKELFIAFNKNQVISVDYNPPKIYKTIVGDVVINEDKQINDKMSISIDDNLKLVIFEQSDNSVTYDILQDVVTVGYITILPKEQYLKAIEIYNDNKKGLGIGTKVLTYLIENGIIDSLDVDRLNEGALHLYERLGFKPYQLIWGSVDGNGNDRYVMVYPNNHKLANCYVYYLGDDSYSSTYADDKMILLGKTLGNGDNYYVLPITDNVWEELEDINIYREDVSEMLYHMKHGRIY